MPANFYNQCPTGTTALPSGSYAIMAPNWVPATNNAAWFKQQSLYAGIGDGSALMPSGGALPTSMPPEVCVAGAPLGQINYGLNLGEFGNVPLVASVYATVTLLQPRPSLNLIDVYIDGALSNQVRW